MTSENVITVHFSGAERARAERLAKVRRILKARERSLLKDPARYINWANSTIRRYRALITALRAAEKITSEQERLAAMSTLISEFNERAS